MKESDGGYRNDFVRYYANFSFLFTSVMFIPSVVSIVGMIVREKELRLREGMAMMGLSTLM